MEFNVQATRPTPISKTVSYRRLSCINIDTFKQEISDSEILRCALQSNYVDTLLDAYTTGLQSLVDKHAPLNTKTVVLRPGCPWFTEDLHDAKHLKRKLERQWHKSNLNVHHEIYRNQCSTVNKLLKSTKRAHYLEKTESCGRDQKLFKVTNHLLGVTNDVTLPSDTSTQALVQKFSDFFVNKVETIRNGINSSASSISLSEASEEEQSSSPSNILTEFRPVTIDEVKRITLQSPNKNCELDPIPTWLLKLCTDDLVELITKLIHSS